MLGVARTPTLRVRADRRRDLGLRLDYRNDLHAALGTDLAGHVLADRGRGVAGDHQQLRAVVEEHLGDPADPLAQHLGVAGPVGEHRGVAEVDEVLLGQGDQALVEDGQPADPRVEHRDRQRGGAAQRNGL